MKINNGILWAYQMESCGWVWFLIHHKALSDMMRKPVRSPREVGRDTKVSEILCVWQLFTNVQFKLLLTETGIGAGVALRDSGHWRFTLSMPLLGFSWVFWLFLIFFSLFWKLCVKGFFRSIDLRLQVEGSAFQAICFEKLRVFLKFNRLCKY